MRRVAAFVWKALVGVLLCLTPITALLVVGWTSRAMQRAVFKTWYADNGHDDETGSFQSAVLRDYSTRRFVRWPNWFIAEDLMMRLGDSKAAEAGVFRRAFVFVVSLFGALWSNLKMGLLTVLATWTLTLPLMMLWLLAWWGGWENSFNKGYEQAWVGPVLGFVATVLFMLAMTYVPLAQARLAAAGTWRSFFDYRLVRSLVTGRPVSVLKLTIYMVIAGLVIAVYRIAPLAIGNFFDVVAELSERRLLALKAGLYGLGAALAFALFVWVRVAAAKVYARAILDAVRNGRLRADRLSEGERSFLTALRLLEPETQDKPGMLTRAVVSSGRGLLRFGVGLPALALWFAFAALIFVTQFFNHDWLAWINHPLIQLPWLSTVRLGFG